MKFIIFNGEQIKAAITHISQLPLDKRFVVEVRHGKRSLDQNALWHKWIEILGNEFGYSPEDMKITLKRKILGMREFVDPLTGEIKETDYSTTKLNKEQFSRLMTQTLALAGEYGIILPSPEDYR